MANLHYLVKLGSAFLFSRAFLAKESFLAELEQRTAQPPLVLNELGGVAFLLCLLVLPLYLLQGGPEWRTHCQTAHILTTTPPILTILGTSHLFG